MQEHSAQHSAADLAAPYGGVLKELIVSSQKAQELKKETLNLPSWDLTQRQACDIELLLSGAFSPLEGFLSKADYEFVCRDMRLQNGLIWPMPITLDVTEEHAGSLKAGSRVALRHPEGMVLAILTVSDVWKPDVQQEAQQVFRTADDTHPGVFTLFHQTNPVYVGGKLEGVELPLHHSFKHLRNTPAELRAAFKARGWSKIVAFQTRNPMHRAHMELTIRAVKETGANLLIHPVVGMTKPGDMDYFMRVRCYEAILPHYPADSTALSLLPLAMRMGGPREAVWHAIIRKNYGCSDFIVGRDHAGPGRDKSGKPFYGPYDAQELLKQHQEELGIRMASFEEMVYVDEKDAYFPVSEVPQGANTLSLSGTQLRELLANGGHIPEWFSYGEVVERLRKFYPPKAQQGFTVFFTGLPSSGKSTLASVLLTKLMEDGSRPITLLDGDLVRKNLSSELGFSKEHRDLNILRIGYVAGEITKNRGVAICAPIAPYTATRRKVRENIEQFGGFIEVHVSTPVEVCEQRDRKGLYAKARAGLLRGLTGVDDPYEGPERPELRIDTADVTPEEGAQQVLDYLDQRGYLPNDSLLGVAASEALSVGEGAQQIVVKYEQAVPGPAQ